MHSVNSVINMQGRDVGGSNPTYFIADIAANHDGSLERAMQLIRLAKIAGADAAKFQHFQAETIVSDKGFQQLGAGSSHQASWDRSVFDVYRGASIDLSWTTSLKKCCDQEGIAFFTSPYSFEMVDHVDAHVPAYKVGSGDITWIELIEYIAAKLKPCLLATGASSLDDVVRAVDAVTRLNADIVLMQCNTNYTGSHENFKYIQLNVLQTFKQMYPGMILGLSDHTPGHSTVLGAVALGAKVIEKHFTDDVQRSGPDHKFSMDPNAWREMVERTRELELALGGGIKKVEENEKETVIVQRRGVCSRRRLYAGEIIQRTDLIPLRPILKDSISVTFIKDLVGKTVLRDINIGEALKWSDLK
jgi:sialic acid synthase SpsE